ncbi:MAG: MalY/PatB family protein [Bacillota bacterium]|nr:pyridoxal phosphate-dependent aminotransferase [Bacillota bacterium]HOC06279.1 MalY/PatB family protein [Bacillota bacterium]HPZ22001.1 MalY/PatB family protein [Bacillota bacterium]HQD19783.1 MalY/PatB family protein [Bacillota bacterium]
MKSFAEVINRRHTGSTKWDGHALMGVPPEAIPLWVADMDFPVMPEVTAAINRRTAHEIYGYSLPADSYFESIQGWMLRRHHWATEKEWILTVPGVVPAINIAVNAFTNPGDAVLIQPPVYPPFANSVLGNGRKLIKNSLIPEGGGYVIDLQDFETRIKANAVKLFILCSPHNPVGRVWTPEELKGMADICRKYDVLIVDDEIHHDLVFPGVRHYPLPALDAAYWEHTIVCTAPSKSFNIAGLQTSNVFIADARLREQYFILARCWGVSKVNAIGLVACEAAYTYGDEWMDAVMAYVAANADYVREFIAENIPAIKVTKSQGLFLLWLDCNALGLSPRELESFFLKKASLWLNQGYTFGDEGSGYVRLNIACPRSLLVKAMEQLKAAVDGSLRKD